MRAILLVAAMMMIAPVASATDSVFKAGGAALGWSRGVGGIMLDDGDVVMYYWVNSSYSRGGWPVIILHACYDPDAPSVTGVCGRFDVMG